MKQTIIIGLIVSMFLIAGCNVNVTGKAVTGAADGGGEPWSEFTVCKQLSSGYDRQMSDGEPFLECCSNGNYYGNSDSSTRKVCYPRNTHGGSNQAQAIIRCDSIIGGQEGGQRWGEEGGGGYEEDSRRGVCNTDDNTCILTGWSCQISKFPDRSGRYARGGQIACGSQIACCLDGGVAIGAECGLGSRPNPAE